MNSANMSGSGSDELKTQFMTREGTYRLMSQADYSRPNRVGYCSATGGQVGGGGLQGSAGGGQGGNPSGAPVKVSFSIPSSFAQSYDTTNSAHTNGAQTDDRIAFNFGREIFVYPYKGLKKSADLTKPLDKRLYKGTCPTCHDFGPPMSTAGVDNGEEGGGPAGRRDSDTSSVSGVTSGGTSNSVISTTGNAASAATPLLVGFSGGQIQLIDPVRKELSKLYNEERHIEKTRVTCIRWVPNTTSNGVGSSTVGGSSNHFLVSYSSGCMYVYNHKLSCAPTAHAPAYQLFKQGQGYAVFTCKTKTTRNPLYKWAVGESVSASNTSTASSINEFAFSPCGHYLAVSSQDGYLRVFNYDTMELVGSARSYFGGLLCVCWSPDGKYVAVGGEDDLVTLYSMAEKRVVVRGQGHKSWVSVVAFDQYNISYGELPDGLDFSGSDEESIPPENGNGSGGQAQRSSSSSVRRKMSASSRRSSSFNISQEKVTCYRFGSVGQDTNLCLWDITEDTLRVSKSDCNTAASGASSHIHKMSNSHSVTSKDSGIQLLQSDSASAVGATGANHSVGSDSGKASSSSTSSSMSLSHRLASLNLTGGGSDKSGGSGGSVRGTLKATLLRGSSDKQSSNSGGSSPSLLSKNSGAAGVTPSSSSGHPDGGSIHRPGGSTSLRLGSAQCPRIDDVPIIEPLVNKKISHERLTALVFKEECLVTACQDGYICTWARPGRPLVVAQAPNTTANPNNANNNSHPPMPSASSTKCPSSPQPGGSTVV